MTDNTIYNNPLITRYASKEMQRAFSDDKRFKLWRKLWIALAESEMELGLNVTPEQGGTEKVCRRYQLRSGGTIRKRGAPRRNGAREGLRRAGEKRHAHHSPRRNELFHQL